jgi:hypothetical protein
MSEYIKSYQVADHTLTISWGNKTPPKPTWRPPLLEEQRRAVEVTEAFELLMISFIGEGMSAIHGTKVVCFDPYGSFDTCQQELSEELQKLK